MDNYLKNNINIKKQSIQLGSSHIIKSEQKNFNRENFMVENMENNLAYKLYIKKNKIDDENKIILKEFIDRYKSYRFGWYHEAEKQYNSKVDFENTQSNLSNPLCLDIEIASICDLGCPHCFREHIITPDKIMPESMFYQLI